MASPTPSSPLMLPSDLPLSYLAEGAANIVYTLPPNSFPSIPYPVLLRLSKTLPSRIPVSTSHGLYTSLINTLLPAQYLIHQTLVSVHPELIARANSALHDFEAAGKRRQKRVGVYLATDEPNALLVEDMRPDVARREVLLEFKPKWLVQSRSAPVGAKRCRTCALRARNQLLRRRKGKAAEKWVFCPLELVCGDEGRVEDVIGKVVRGRLDQAGVKRVMGFLGKAGVLERVRDLQVRMDGKGVLEADVWGQDFRVAMTVRDCSVFLKVPVEGEMQLRLADLDLKSAGEGKAERWKALERELIDDGWYMGTEKDPESDKTWCQALLS
ncbi:MAG: Inositol-pentakisphosphate 2-kinase [Vezdaea aestivalis]|nr:MAG: Inositol-pentakisphosphate 2-kinase [Vezdaea aestivalis]